MALDKVHLKKLLQLFLLSEKRRASAIRSDALQKMKRRDEGPKPGGDFHVTFWRDAKEHAAGRRDLRESTPEAIKLSKPRERLFPLLQNGFLLWWDEKRRWVNEPISALPKAINYSVGFAEIDGVVEVENLLSL